MSEPSNLAALIQLIRSAFPHRIANPLPLISPETHRDEEVIETERTFAGVTDWTNLSAHALDSGWASGLAFLSDEAVCFFIPAYLVADVGGKLARADPVSALINGLDGRHGSTHATEGMTAEQRAQERWRRLTRAQCEVVAGYLRHKHFKEPHLQDAIAPALNRYWLPRAAT